MKKNGRKRPIILLVSIQNQKKTAEFVDLPAKTLQNSLESQQIHRKSSSHLRSTARLPPTSWFSSALPLLRVGVWVWVWGWLVGWIDWGLVGIWFGFGFGRLSFSKVAMVQKQWYPRARFGSSGNRKDQ